MQTPAPIMIEDKHGTLKKVWSKPAFEVISRDIIKCGVATYGPELTPSYAS